MSYIDMIKERARLDKKTIVLPESNDKRTLLAAARIVEEGIDHRGGTSGLSYDHIFLHNIFSLCSFLTIIKHPSIGASG